MATERPWMVLVPQPLLSSAPCPLFGIVDREKRLVRVESTSAKAGFEDVGFIHCNTGRGGSTVLSLSGAYSVGQIAILDFDRLRSICQLHCCECVSEILGSKLASVQCLEVPRASQDQCCSCLRKAKKKKRTVVPVGGVLSHSFLLRLLRHRYMEGVDCAANVKLDVFCGALVVAALWWFLSPVVLSEIMRLFVAGSSSAVTILQQLMVWLMGAPAGLKINRQMSWFLGQFYLYHVTLWYGYVSSFVVPYLLIFLSYFPYIGIMGLTVFLALLLDVLNIFVVHLSCFYIYACKLYRLQTRLLYSLGCLFRGKKWNPLRQRVDTAPFLTDRMFVGVLIFSMTVFLLPTTALFYSVFTAVRIVILLLQYLISRPVSLLMSVPVTELMLWATNSDQVRDRIEINVLQSCEKQVFFKVIFQREKLLPFYRENKYNVTGIFGKSLNISTVIGSIFRGDIL